MNLIAVCSCSGMKERADSAFKILFPHRELPPVYRGKDAMKKFADEHPSTNVGNYLSAISKKHGQFAYFIEYDKNGDVVANYNLLTGKKVA